MDPEGIKLAGENKIFLGTSGVLPFDEPGNYTIQILASTFSINFFDEMKDLLKKSPYSFGILNPPLYLQSKLQSSPEWEARQMTINFGFGTTASVNITSKPAEAKIYLNNQLKGTTPYTLIADPGIYKIKLTKDGYDNYEETLRLSGGENPSKDIILNAGRGEKTVTINSLPEDSELIVDGRKVGKTPVTVRLSYGMHPVTVYRDGYLYHSEILYITPDNLEQKFAWQLEVDNSLSDSRGKIQLFIAPDSATVKIDGVEQRLRDIALNPGSHIIQVSKTGYKDCVELFSLAPNQSKYISVNLEPQIYNLMVNVQNSTAKVFVNGLEYGNTPISLQLAEGRYQITLVSPGFRTIVKDISLRMDRVTELNERMDWVQN
jgi:hypothetical protein